MIRLVLLCLALPIALPHIAAAAPPDGNAPGKTVVAEPLGWQPWEPAPGQGDDARVRYYTSAGSTFLEVDLAPNTPAEPVQAHYLDDPPRAYIDIDFIGEEAPLPVALVTAEIAGLRFGVHQTPAGRVLRCVIDLRDQSIRVVAVELVQSKLILEATSR